ncbi:unnamed protein product, partial [Oppiella nova]
FPLLEFLSVKEVRHDYQLIHSVVVNTTAAVNALPPMGLSLKATCRTLFNVSEIVTEFDPIIYEENEILEGKLELLSNTNMVDFALDVYKRLHEDVEPPQHLFDKRQDVVSQMKHLQVQTGPMLEILLKDEVQSEIEKSRDSRLLYELLQTKHDGRELLIEMFLEKKGNYLKQQPYLNAIQTMCPHILRYLTTAVITHRQRRQYMKDLVRVIQQESYTYRDPITEFVECLYVNFDFDGAQKKLRECEIVLDNDFFLVACLDDFIENARLFIFETFCQIHECISINMLADKLNMSGEDAERWIVNLIRNAQLDAKIDSKFGHVVMGTQAVSQYQQLIEKTKSMAIRTQVLVMNIEKKIASS